MFKSNKDVVDSRRLSTGAKIIFFNDGKYKFIPSKTYIETKRKNILKGAIQKADNSDMRRHCSKLIDDIFTLYKKQIA